MERIIVVFVIFVVLLISFSSTVEARRSLCNVCDCQESQITCMGIEDLKILRTYRGGNIRTLFITDSSGDTVEDEDVRRFRSISALYFQNSDLSTEKVNMFESVTELLLLDLQSNSLTEVYMHTFAENTKLLNLNLAKNKISYIENNAFASSGELVYLTLSDNHLETLEGGAFSGLKELTSLDLSGNGLRSLSAETLAPLESLEELLLERNALSAIDAELARQLARPGLATALGGNSFRCTCETLGAAYAATASAGRTVLDVTCDDGKPWNDVMATLNCPLGDVKDSDDGLSSSTASPTREEATEPNSPGNNKGTEGIVPAESRIANVNDLARSLPESQAQSADDPHYKTEAVIFIFLVCIVAIVSSLLAAIMIALYFRKKKSADKERKRLMSTGSDSGGSV